MIKVLYIITSCRRLGPMWQTINIIKNLDRKVFTPYVLAIYPERSADSMKAEVAAQADFTLIKTGKLRAAIGSLKKIKKYIDELKPDVIHSLGVFPDYIVKRLKISRHVLTVRNYVYDDYPDKYGKLLGGALAKIHLKAIKACRFRVACSESLTEIYKSRLNIDIPFIRNGTDTAKFRTGESKEKLREKLDIPRNKTVFVYSGAFIGRKNQAIFLECAKKSEFFDKMFIVLLGDGQDYSAIKEEYADCKNVLMPGHVDNVAEYLGAADYYVSTSKSEGLPNNVLEALAAGLFVILSDIKQHLEILNVESGLGVAYESGNKEDFVKALSRAVKGYEFSPEKISGAADRHFSSERMAEEYQELYKKIYSEKTESRRQ